MRQITCCFSGHRTIPASCRQILETKTRQAIISAYGEGYRRFVCGGAVGYDTLCAETVLSLKEKFPEMKLVLIYPCKGQDAKWSRSDKERYRQIERQSDECYCLNESYTPTCMHERNRAMVDESSLLIAYWEKCGGGTAYTCNYARSQRVRLVNLAFSKDQQLFFFNDGVIL